VIFRKKEPSDGDGCAHCGHLYCYHSVPIEPGETPNDAYVGHVGCRLRDCDCKEFVG
jgi:hypothetical protein